MLKLSNLPRAQELLAERTRLYAGYRQLQVRLAESSAGGTIRVGDFGMSLDGKSFVLAAVCIGERYEEEMNRIQAELTSLGIEVDVSPVAAA